MIDPEPAPVNISPVGRSIDEARQRRAATDPDHRSAYDALSVARQVASQVLVYRLDHGLTQQQFAELAGTSMSQISKMESGVRNPTVQTLQQLAKTMGKQLTVSFVDAVGSHPIERRDIRW